MAKNEVREYAVTAAANTDIAGIGILGTNNVSNFDGAFREIMADLARLNTGDAPLNDTFSVCDPADVTKKVRIDAGNVAAGQLRVLSMPNADVSISAFMATVLDDVNSATVRTTINAQRAVEDVATLELNANTATDSASFIDFHARAGSDLDARIIRNLGTNGSFVITQSGTGAFQLDGGNSFTRNGSTIVIANGATYNINISGSAAFATNASTAANAGNSDLLDGMDSSFFQQALSGLIPMPAAGRIHVVGKWAGSGNLGYIAMDTSGNYISFTSF